MATAPVVQTGEPFSKRLSSRKIVWILGALCVGICALVYKSQTASAVHLHAARPVSAADGRVHGVAPTGELDAESFDGNIFWNPYPNAASYEVAMFRFPEQVWWKESTKVDHITMHTELFPPLLKRMIDVNATVGYAVKALDASGKVIADSGPQYFYVKVPPTPGFGN